MRNTLFMIFFLSSILIGCSSTNENKDDPDKKAQVFYQFGTHKLTQKNYTGALSDLIKAYELSPRNKDILNNLAMAYRLKNFPEKALQHFDAAIRLDPTFTLARSNRASLYLEMGRIADAESEFQLVLQDLKFTEHYRTNYNLALIEIKKNNLAQAVSFLKKSIEELKDYCPAHFQMGKLNFEQGFFIEAEKHFLEGIQGECYKEIAPHYYLGLTYEKLQYFQKAITKFDEITLRYKEHHLVDLAKIKLEQLRKIHSPLLADPITSGNKL